MLPQLAVAFQPIFLNNLVPLEPSQNSYLIEQLKTMTHVPDIFWYPGSGTDLTPLLLEVPGNSAERSLHKINCCSADNPLVLWMNDDDINLKKFPHLELLGNKIEHNKEYATLWADGNTTATLGSSKEEYILDGNVEITLFTVEISSNVQNKNDLNGNYFVNRL